MLTGRRRSAWSRCSCGRRGTSGACAGCATSSSALARTAARARPTRPWTPGSSRASTPARPGPTGAPSPGTSRDGWTAGRCGRSTSAAAPGNRPRCSRGTCRRARRSSASRSARGSSRSPGRGSTSTKRRRGGERLGPRAVGARAVLRRARARRSREGSVDLVNSSGAVGCHFDVDSTELLAGEVARVLRPGGLAMIDSGPSGRARRRCSGSSGARLRARPPRPAAASSTTTCQLCFRKARGGLTSRRAWGCASTTASATSR